MSTPLTEARHFRLALFWAGLGAAGAVAVLPYAMALAPTTQPLPLPVLAIAAGVQMGVLLLLLNWLGLRLGYPLSLDSPLARAWVYRQALPPIAPAGLKLALAIGGLGGLLLVGLDLAFQPWMPSSAMLMTPTIALWKRWLAAFYGGITEELLLRLFGMTGITWLLWKGLQRNQAQPSPILYWVAIAIAAVLFGLGHLPTAATLWGFTPVVILRTLTLNAVLGIPFGFLYWQWGLEYAMLAHFCADIVLQGLSSVLPG
ncbi:MAG: CPBP family intramembrane glutamic endopeptidase [Leptolyngbyaceae cyanobacterium bins.349]|nr:CPBP family intramembrane glutamic endopeptidase [Leptolyngbyaceae cyanobacterium bins.349]